MHYSLLKQRRFVILKNDIYYSNKFVCFKEYSYVIFISIVGTIDFFGEVGKTPTRTRYLCLDPAKHLLRSFLQKQQTA